MQSTIEVKALGFALGAALLALGSAGMGSVLLSMIPSSSTAPAFGEDRFIVNATAPEVIDQGRRFYALSCSHCHGDDATGGDEGPDLHYLPISNAHIATTIKKGIKGQMPTFAKKYDDRQIAILTSYLRSLQ
jgi:mono/diheme cytochrome c family protein